MTALQELIEILNESQKFINDNDSKEDKYYRRGLREAIEEANKLIEKEKKQIIEAFYQGRNLYNDFDDDPEIYYDETYKQ